MVENLKNKYQKSEHYLGSKGAEYFSWQNPGKHFAARIYEHKFKSYIKPEHVVVDFGCGGGQILNRLNCKKKIGIEINSIARECAEDLGIECYENISELADNSIDVVISHHALEHVEYPIGVLRELNSKLKHGGLLILCVPIDNWRNQNVYDPNDKNHHLQTWTKQLLGNTLFEAGYKIIDIKYRIEAWPKNWTVFLYGRFPNWFFYSFCYALGIISGNGRELLSIAEK